MWVFDAADPPNLTSVSNAGGVGVGRYVKKNLPNEFELGTQERLDILSGGFGLLYNAEQSANDLTTQPTSYFHDYGQQVAALLTQVGAPTLVDVPLSADTEVTAGTLAKVMNNYSAFAAAVEPYGCIGYAQTNVISLLVTEKISRPGRKHWLPGSIGWSPGYSNTKASWQQYILFPYAGLVQLGPQAVGWFNAPTVAGCDTNLLLDAPSMGFEWPPGSPYAPKGSGMPLFHVSDGEGHTFYTDGLTKQQIVSGGAEGGAQAAIKAGQVIDGSAYFTPDQVLAMPTQGAVTVTIPPVEVTVPPIVFPPFPAYQPVPATPEASA